MIKELIRSNNFRIIFFFLCILSIINYTVFPVYAKESEYGWEEEDGYQYYYYKDGSFPEGKVKIKGKTYLFSEEGYKITPAIIQHQLDQAHSAKKVKSYGGYKLPKSRYNRLQYEVSKINKLGYDVSFILLDPVTGEGVSYNADGVFYSASSVKGIYIASIVSNNPKIFNADHAAISAVLTYSDNSMYYRLRKKYGPGPMYKWCEKSGVSPSLGNNNYTYYSSRTLAKLWGTNLMYFYSGSMGEKLGKMYEHPNISTIHTTLGGKYTTRTKAGWIAYPKTKATTDGGIVYKGKNGTRPVIIAITSNIPGSHNTLNGLVYELNKTHDLMLKNE